MSQLARHAQSNAAAVTSAIFAGAADDAGEHAGAWRSIAGGVVLLLPPPNGGRRRALARCRAGLRAGRCAADNAAGTGTAMNRAAQARSKEM